MSRYKYLIKYELLTMIRCGYIPAFGIALPCLLFALVGPSVVAKVPALHKQQVLVEVFVSFATIIPLAGVFLGHGANYSREYEEQVPQRLNLFGISTRMIVVSKLVAQLLFVVFAVCVYSIFAFVVGFKFSSGIVFLSTLILLLLQSVSEFILAHGFVNLFKKFGPAYTATMIFYFGSMIVSGNMGLPQDMLPKFFRFIGEILLPFVEFKNFTVNLMAGKVLDWQALLLANLWFFLIAAFVFLIARIRDKRAV